MLKYENLNYQWTETSKLKIRNNKHHAVGCHRLNLYDSLLINRKENLLRYQEVYKNPPCKRLNSLQREGKKTSKKKNAVGDLLRDLRKLQRKVGNSKRIKIMLVFQTSCKESQLLENPPRKRGSSVNCMITFPRSQACQVTTRVTSWR